MKKALLAFLFLMAWASAFADYCTVVIRDPYGREYDTFTRSSYAIEAACSDARYECQQRLSEHQSYGRYYEAQCVIKNTRITNRPIPPIPPAYPYPEYPNYPRYPDYPHYPRYPDYPRYPEYPRYPAPPRYPRDPYPVPRDPREPPRHYPGSEPRPNPARPRR